MFDVKDVSCAVADRVLLAPLTLSLAARRLTGLIGHNGSGKSTLVRILARQQPVSTGEVLYDGRPLPHWDARAFARKVGYLPQATPPAPGLLVHELVALGRYPWHGALGRFERRDRDKVAEAIELTRMGPFRDRLVDTLSGGERQRAWLAMLVAQDTEFLLLDEPVSALDVAHQVEVMSLVRQLSRSRDLGVVVVLHDVNLAARFCDEILALQGGRLLARGRPPDLMTPNRLEEIYGVAMDVVPHPTNDYPVALVR